MKSFSLSCYQPKKTYPKDCFYILSRGINTGRPSKLPNVNCYVFSCHPKDTDRYYWLVYALWESEIIKSNLHGSVILFIRLDQLRKLISSAVKTLPELDKQFVLLQQLIEAESKIKEQLSTIQNIRCLIARKITNSAA